MTQAVQQTHQGVFEITDAWAWATGKFSKNLRGAGDGEEPGIGVAEALHVIPASSRV